MTLLDGDAARSVAFTADLAVHLDERQYSRGFGPCMDAAVSGETVNTKHPDSDDYYPDFGAAAARAVVHSSLSVGCAPTEAPTSQLPALTGVVAGQGWAWPIAERRPKAPLSRRGGREKD